MILFSLFGVELVDTAMRPVVLHTPLPTPSQARQPEVATGIKPFLDPGYQVSAIAALTRHLLFESKLGLKEHDYVSLSSEN